MQIGHGMQKIISLKFVSLKTNFSIFKTSLKFEFSPFRFKRIFIIYLKQETRYDFKVLKERLLLLFFF